MELSRTRAEVNSDWHVGRLLARVRRIAAIFNVEPKTVSMWRLRYPEFPEPDVIVGGMAGWDPERAEEIRVWESPRPGQGSRAMLAEHVQEKYEDGRLADGMQAKAAAHLIGALRDALDAVCVRGSQGGVPFINGAPNLTTDALADEDAPRNCPGWPACGAEKPRPHKRSINVTI